MRSSGTSAADSSPGDGNGVNARGKMERPHGGRPGDAVQAGLVQYSAGVVAYGQSLASAK